MFSGTFNFETWFSGENLISSFPWNLEPLTSSDAFQTHQKSGKLGLEVGTNLLGDNCDDAKYLRVLCHDPPMDCGDGNT